MTSILLDTLVEDLEGPLREFLGANPELREVSESFLHDLLVNDDLLSTDTFTTSSESTRNKTLTEEIAELDDSSRVANRRLAQISNDNRDLIIRVSQDLKHINQSITSEMKTQVESMIKGLKADDKRLHVPANDQLTAAMETNSSILSNIDSILDLLELPTLCKICILQGNYQEALEISILSRNLTIRFPKLPIFSKIYEQIKVELKLMVKNLIKLLNTNLRQNNLIKIFNILSKLDLLNFRQSDIISSSNSAERTRFLKLLYFNSRYKYIINETSNLMPLIKFNRFSYLKRFIEVYRSEVYHSLSMFYTIINHSLNLESNEKEDNLLINQFVKNLAYHLINELKLHLHQLSIESKQSDDPDKKSDFSTQIDGLILQIIYLCKSLAKYHQSFENIIVWELCYNSKETLISEADWLANVSKVKKLKA
ncbi:hypothetical protein PSN45_000301 [Yamadazyma tenuis]|uniref:Conserved oligomeric Golgi complex subunit 8 n=1 Tax=Candida tenuis (strain ATCC 10573 / BCRC 21748 / CBS 615 / JCM 9827 / NBRC 10315 / NRRL Y-1498 / VKM Y-70) TaxID=590646 RepID=G3B7I2_CANTC|nr:uncharacterized protein CANTEDRAFT_115082 [Yamadazyma tenuis ATCC 10573]XP_006688756.1 uncharacterized protein CANTEDRAFT_115082 [Yamadazyma tenuis ATCC 10573]EGV62585.1 hypothetical protein CANTEDRAFT_115082 [Yamadazyma tenuis ATCC 10573]EGV62586.1 hypothetical protein CANTEDRAFT_115082 [Yamadazyma tenuis ATCC 10573]WEJ92843.1 hypothetical protein PSN45_000301 [Yamadazyma tenuis]